MVARRTGEVEQDLSRASADVREVGLLEEREEARQHGGLASDGELGGKHSDRVGWGECQGR